MARRVKAPLTGFQAAIYLRETYESMHGFADLDAVDPARPLALVAESPRDGNRKMWMRYKRYSQYRIHGIWDIYHISLLEFINLPTADIEWLIADTAFEHERRTALTKEAQNPPRQ